MLGCLGTGRVQSQAGKVLEQFLDAFGHVFESLEAWTRGWGARSRHERLCVDSHDNGEGGQLAGLERMAIAKVGLVIQNREVIDVDDANATRGELNYRAVTLTNIQEMNNEGHIISLSRMH